MLHTAGVSIPEISVPSPGRNKPPPRILGGSLLIACSSRSDSGVRREGREREKNKEGEKEGTRSFAFIPTPPPRWFFFFFFFSHLFVVSPRSERLEQTTLLIPETLFFELSVANSIPAFMFLTYSSILFGIAPSALMIFGTTFTLSIFHNSHSRWKNINSVSLCGFSFTVISSECDHGGSLWQRRPKGSEPLGTRITFFLFYTLFFAHAQCVSPLCFGEYFSWRFCTTSVASNLCTQIISSLRALFKFQVTLFDFIILFLRFYTVGALPRPWCEKNNSRKTYSCMYFHYVLVTFRYFTFPK